MSTICDLVRGADSRKLRQWGLNHQEGYGVLKGESRENFQARVIDDLEKSAQRLEDELGNEVLYFAYPYGVKDSWAADYIAGRFAMTVLTREGVADLSKGFYSLPRKTVSMDRRVSRCF